LFNATDEISSYFFEAAAAAAAAAGSWSVTAFSVAERATENAEARI
jgi:hypothetical protein